MKNRGKELNPNPGVSGNLAIYHITYCGDISSLGGFRMDCIGFGIILKINFESVTLQVTNLLYLTGFKVVYLGSSHIPLANIIGHILKLGKFYFAQTNTLPDVDRITWTLYLPSYDDAYRVALMR